MFAARVGQSIEMFFRSFQETKLEIWRLFQGSLTPFVKFQGCNSPGFATLQNLRPVFSPMCCKSLKNPKMIGFYIFSFMFKIFAK